VALTAHNGRGNGTAKVESDVMDSSTEGRQGSKCIECGGATHPIEVLSATELLYKPPGRQSISWNGRYENGGVLEAELCETCRRVTFRAKPDLTEE
jgi:hypothetical protein